MVAKSKKSLKVFSWILGIFCIMAIVFMVDSNWKIQKRKAQLDRQLAELGQEVSAMEEKNQDLKERMFYIESQDYLEQVAREQLDMKKPGEEVIVIQREENEKKREEQNDSWWGRLKSIFSR